jgi:hypothetical protein
MFANVRQHIAYWIFPERVPPHDTLRAVLFDVIRALAMRTTLLQTYQIRHVHRGLVGVHLWCILSRLEIIIHVQNSVAWRHFVLQRLHVAEVTYLHILFARSAVTFATLVFPISSRDGPVAGGAVSQTLTDGLFIFTRLLLVIVKT